MLFPMASVYKNKWLANRLYMRGLNKVNFYIKINL